MCTIARCPICFQCKDISKFLFHRCGRPECAICRERKQYPPHPIFVKFEDPDASFSVDISQLAEAMDTRADIDTAYSLEHLGQRLQAATSGSNASEAAIAALREASERLVARLPIIQDLGSAQEKARSLEERNRQLEASLSASEAAHARTRHETEKLSRRIAELQEKSRLSEQRATWYQCASEDTKTELEQTREKNARLHRRVEKLEEEVRNQERAIRAKDKELAAVGSELSVTKKKMRGMARQNKRQGNSKTAEDESLVVL
ncbi:uncharacterized protein SCHCODRAFT_02660682 [Schizophyllum commune H4-8]|nr:uncharacterized protein SCHCODRAFT_02660682 [Schizophyllum commune H4-8]KAI5898991.1 hypothetical protein SCHCODRAFT_02660682 [Schizophyllum commune H4-8]